MSSSESPSESSSESPPSPISEGDLRLSVPAEQTVNTPAPPKNVSQWQLMMEMIHKKHEEALREQRVSIDRLEQTLLSQQQQYKKSMDEIKSKTNDVISNLRNQISSLKKNSKTLASEVAMLKKNTSKKETPASTSSGSSNASSWGLSSFLGASDKGNDLQKLASKCAKQMQNFHTRLQVVQIQGTHELTDLYAPTTTNHAHNHSHTHAHAVMNS